jgi:hypothetical protein
MSEIAKLLRLQAPAVREIKSSQFNVLATITGEALSSALAEGYTRKRLFVHNATHSSSGEVYFGGEGVTVDDGMLLKKNEWIELPIGSPLDVYFVATSSDGIEIRVVELA